MIILKFHKVTILLITLSPIWFKESCLLPALCIYEVEINFFKPNLSKFAAKYLVKFDHSGSSHGNKNVLFLKTFLLYS